MGKTIAAVVGGVLLLVLLPVAFFGIRWATADIRGAGDAREQILADGDFRIQAYQTFFDLCASVQSQEDRIDSLDQELNDENNPPTDARVGQIQSSLSAIRSTRGDLINQYNADASRSWTEGQFRDEDLPYQLNIDEEDTTCVIE